MPYPFPGMNPWLESSKIWKDVHHRLISAIGDYLSDLLEPRYYVGIETHTYIGESPGAPATRMRYPDLTILETGGRAIAVAPTAQTAMPLTIDLPPDEAVEEPYLEVRLVPSGRVITVIEILSHTNKEASIERASYIKKRKLFLNATINFDVNFVEIDLLRAWLPMPECDLESDPDYRIFIRRAETHRKALLYTFNVRDVIPTFPLPLQPDDQEPIIDLNNLLQQVYDRARYRLILNYNKPPDPMLRKEDEGWARELVSKQ